MEGEELEEEGGALHRDLELSHGPYNHTLPCPESPFMRPSLWSHSLSFCHSTGLGQVAEGLFPYRMTCEKHVFPEGLKCALPRKEEQRSLERSGLSVNFGAGS
jgi:hypothetical protein